MAGSLASRRAKKSLKKYLTGQSRLAFLDHAKSERHERAPAGRCDGLDLGEQLRRHLGGRDLRSRRGKKRQLLLFLQVQIGAGGGGFGGLWNKKKAEMDSIFSPTVPPLERFDRYFDFVHDRLAEVQKKCGSILGCPFISVGSEVSTQDQIVRETIDRIMDRKVNYFVSAVRDAAAEGLIDAPDPEAKARALFSCYQGMMAQARIQNDIELLRGFKEVAMDVLGVKRASAMLLHNSSS